MHTDIYNYRYILIHKAYFLFYMSGVRLLWCWVYMAPFSCVAVCLILIRKNKSDFIFASAEPWKMVKYIAQATINAFMMLKVKVLIFLFPNRKFGSLSLEVWAHKSLNGRWFCSCLFRMNGSLKTHGQPPPKHFSALPYSDLQQLWHTFKLRSAAVWMSPLTSPLGHPGWKCSQLTHTKTWMNWCWAPSLWHKLLRSDL